MLLFSEADLFEPSELLVVFGGATLVEECSWVLVGKKSAVDTLEMLDLCLIDLSSVLSCGRSLDSFRSKSQGHLACTTSLRFGEGIGDGVGGTNTGGDSTLGVNVFAGSYVGLVGFRLDP